MRDFTGRVAVITGGASGIGLGMAERFAEEGMRVVLADVEEPALDAAVTELRRKEHDVIGVRTDVSDPASVEALARQVIETYGKVHVLCNNAGVSGTGGLVWEKTLSDWQWVMGVNFWSVVHGIRAFVPGMIAHGEEGHVVNTASILGMLPGGNWMGIYAASKHAVVSLSEYLYRSLQSVDAKIGASVLCPSFVSTNLGSSARNRPEALQDGAEVRWQRDDFEMAGFQDALDHRITPYEAGGLVIDAVRNDRFWIQTDHLLDDLIRDRFEGMLSGRNPWS